MNKAKAFKFAREAFSGIATQPARLGASTACEVDGEEVVLLQAYDNETVIVLYGKDIDTVATSCRIAQLKRQNRKAGKGVPCS